uniref:(northern house mosquito) hypothetical protein n=1 Tax=Culex pipiens TaxID=7175 RepID=A0A8D8FFG5_CULPI
MVIKNLFPQVLNLIQNPPFVLPTLPIQHLLSRWYCPLVTLRPLSNRSSSISSVSRRPNAAPDPVSASRTSASPIRSWTSASSNGPCPEAPPERTWATDSVRARTRRRNAQQLANM